MHMLMPISFTLYLLQITVFDEHSQASAPPPVLTWFVVLSSTASASNATCSSGKKSLRRWRSSAAFSRAHAVRAGLRTACTSGLPRRSSAGTGAQGREKTKALAPFSCLNSKPISGTYICSPYLEPDLFLFFLTTGLVVPVPGFPIFPGAPGWWCRPPRSLPGLSGLYLYALGSCSPLPPESLV